MEKDLSLQVIDKPVGPKPAIYSLTASRDAATVQRIIRERYGFEPTLDYCTDLIMFVEALTDGQQ